MVLKLITTFLTLCNSFNSFGVVKNMGTNPQSFTFSSFGDVYDYTDLTTANDSPYDYNYQSGSTEYDKYLLKRSIVTLYSDEDIGNYGYYTFTAMYPEEVLNSWGINNNDDYTIFELNINCKDEDYSGNSVLSIYYNNSIVLCNAVFDFDFRFYKLDVNYGDLQTNEVVYYHQSIELYKQYTTNEVVKNLPINQLLDVQQTYCYCDVVVSLHLVSFDDIKQSWYDEGYIDGKNDGTALAGNTSFTALLGNIIDAPILFLRKFFGYEVLGVNLYYALATIMSLIVAIAIFRLVRGIV